MLCSYSFVQSHWAVYAVILSAPWGQTHRHSAQKTVHQKSWPQLDPGFLQLLAEMRLSLFVLFLLWGNVDVSLSQNAKPCDNPDDIDNGHYQITRVENFLLGTQISYFCNEGYHTRSNDFTRTCTLDGWAGHVPECHRLSCEHPPKGGGVIVKGLPDHEGDPILPDHFLDFICDDPRKHLSGSSRLRCGKDGQWDNPFPSCEEVICSRPDDLQVRDWRYWRQRFSLGDTASYDCVSGYRRTGGASQATCTRNGWTPNPLCEEVKCSVPVIENGEVLGRVTEYKEHETLHFVCNPKYKPAEDRSSKCTKLGQKAEFTPTPVCEQTKCKLQLPQETRYEPHRNVFLPGETLRVFCGDQHWIVDPQSNSAVFTCGDDGNWDNEPVCKEVTCRRPDDWQLRDGKVREFYGTNWPYWRQRFSLGDTASYSCASGYRRTGGASQATCTRNGWTPNPLCEGAANNGTLTF